MRFSKDASSRLGEKELFLLSLFSVCIYTYMEYVVCKSCFLIFINETSVNVPVHIFHVSIYIG